MYIYMIQLLHYYSITPDEGPLCTHTHAHARVHAIICRVGLTITIRLLYGRIARSSLREKFLPRG